MNNRRKVDRICRTDPYSDKTAAELFDIYRSAKTKPFRNYVRTKLGENVQYLMYSMAATELRKRAEELPDMQPSEIVSEMMKNFLRNGVNSFDPSRGIKISTYLRDSVWQAIDNIQSLRVGYTVGQNTLSEKREMLSCGVADFNSVNFTESEIELISRRTGFTKSKVRDILGMPYQDKYSELDNIGLPRDSVIEDLIYKERMENIAQALRTAAATGVITEKDLFVLDGRFGLGLGLYTRGDGRDNDHTLQKIGDRLQVSRTSIENWINETCEKLREWEPMERLASYLDE